jgi:hypothetical protein
MKYIWEVVTKDKLGDAALSDVSFVPARNFSPYMEVNFDNLNEMHVGDNLRIEVNPFVRFCEIFEGYLRPEFTEFEEYREALFDMLMHFLLATDKKSGHTDRSIRKLLIARNIRNGAMGRDIKNDFASVSDFERDAITDGLISLLDHGLSVYLHGKVCKRIFPNMISYLKIRGERVIFLYLGIPKTLRGEAAERLCQRLFLPADLKTDVYWDKHFSIIGIPETMRIDETVPV